MKNAVKLFIILAFASVMMPVHAKASKRPNVLIILSDDQGWGDVGFNGGTDIPTPNLDTLANHGVYFSQGYASHPYCSPSRAGLLAGRAQQRFGHENNIPFNQNAKENYGLPLSEELLPATLKKAGYRTAAIGKWHLGDFPQYLPTNRGFDDWYGFSGGAAHYWEGGSPSSKHVRFDVMRNGVPVPKDHLTYLTDNFSEEASAYIRKYAEDEAPFFMYLAYNAPHGPIQSPKKYLDRAAHIEDGERAAYAAMVIGMDDGIGQVIKTLKETGEYDNTLIIFYSDNGAHLSGASSGPFRGYKGMLFEGGIRVPFLMSWPKKIKPGKRYDNAITALDIFPTVLAATGAPTPNKHLDGINLLPYISGKKKSAPHKTLFWRYSDGEGWVARRNDMKLVYSAYKHQALLFDLKHDPYEQRNLATDKPKVVAELTALYKTWSKNTVKGIWPDEHIRNVNKTEKIRQSFIDKAGAGEKK